MTSGEIGSIEKVTAPDGVSLAVRQYGVRTAPTVVCVHGYPDNSSMWDGVVDLLAERFHVVTYDVRGAGDSDKPRERAAYRLDTLVDDMAAVLDAFSPRRPVHLLAHDWGSIQSWHGVTDERLRGRVASFTSVSGPCLDHVGFWMRAQLRGLPRTVRNVVEQLSSSVYIGFFLMPLLPQLAIRAGVLNAALASASRYEGVSGPGKPRLAARHSDAVFGLGLYRANIPARLRDPRPRHTEVPVQILTPNRDLFVRPPMQTDIGSWAPDLRVRRVQGGHWLPRSRPAAVAERAAELIDHVEGGPETRALRFARVGGSRRDGRFADQLVVVTGAGSGIGRATALAFAEQGADVVAADIDGDSAQHTAWQARQLGVDAGAYTLDVSDGKAMEHFASQVRAEFGVPDVLVNNAGIGVAGSFVDTTVADWERVVDVNLWGVIHGMRVFAAQLLEHAKGGRIVNVASAAAYLPARNLAAYSATKAAVHQLGDCVRGELTSAGIGVITICPGVVNTNIARTSRFVGLGPDAQEASRAGAARAYRLRNYPPERVAAQILKAVRRNKPLVPVTPEARVALALSRLTPAVLRAGARLDIGGR